MAAAWGCPVREAQARCDAREFAEWQAYQSQRGPIGPQAGYRQAAWIALHVIASQSTKGNLKLEDFMMKFDEKQPARRMSAKQMMDVMRGVKDPFK